MLVRARGDLPDLPDLMGLPARASEADAAEASLAAVRMWKGVLKATGAAAG